MLVFVKEHGISKSIFNCDHKATLLTCKNTKLSLTRKKSKEHQSNMAADQNKTETATNAESNELNALDATKGTFTIKQKKKEVDYSEDVQREAQKAQDLLQQHGTSKLKEALEGLMVWEKKSRLVRTFSKITRIRVQFS